MMVEVLVIACMVIVVDIFLKAFYPDISRQLGPYVGLIITNCIVMGHTEAVALSSPPLPRPSTGSLPHVGYSYVLLLIARCRELLGTGSVWGVHVLGPHWVNWSIMVMAPGGFFVLAVFVWIVKGWFMRPARSAGLTCRSRLLHHLVFAVFTNNILDQLPRDVLLSRRVARGQGLLLGTAVFVTAATTALNWAVYYHILVPLNLVYSFCFIVFIVVIAAFVQLVEMIIERVSGNALPGAGHLSAAHHGQLRDLGRVCLFMVIRDYSPGSLVTLGPDWAGRWRSWRWLLHPAAARAALAHSARLEGLGIALIIAGTMALAFMGFNGMVSRN